MEQVERFPRICKCGHQRHAHKNGQGPCRPCNLGDFGDCQEYEEGEITLNIRYANWHIHKMLSPMLLDNHQLPFKEVIKAAFSDMLDEFFEGIQGR